MKWFALLLFMVSVIVYYLPDYAGPSDGMSQAASGSLPRVASLKMPAIGYDDSVADDRSQASARACVRLGWIESRARADRLMAAPRLGGASQLAVEEVERDLPPLHWIIIPPQSLDAALSEFRAIQRRGIDSYLVTRGENRNAISLGLFESLDSAISVLEEKKRQNLNAVLVNFPRNQISYALSFEAESGQITDLVRSVEADYGSDFEVNEIRPCEGVATPEKSP